jgi:hypothetical protein
MSLREPYTLLTLPPELRLQIYALLLPTETPTISSANPLSIPLPSMMRPESNLSKIHVSDPAYPKQSSIIPLLHCSRQTRAELYPLLSPHRLLDKQGRLAWKLDCEVHAEDVICEYSQNEKCWVPEPAVFLYPSWTQFPGISRFIPTLEMSVSLVTGFNVVRRWLFMFIMTLRLLERYVNHGPAFGAEETGEEELEGLKIGSLILNVEFKPHPDHDAVNVRRTQKTTATLIAKVRTFVYENLVSSVQGSDFSKLLRERVGEFCIREGEWVEVLTTACCAGENSTVGEAV